MRKMPILNLPFFCRSPNQSFYHKKPKGSRCGTIQPEFRNGTMTGPSGHYTDKLSGAFPGPVPKGPNIQISGPKTIITVKRDILNTPPLLGLGFL